MFFLLISIGYGSNGGQNQISQIVQHFYFDLTCSNVIGNTEVKSIRFLPINVPDRRLFFFLNRLSIS